MNQSTEELAALGRIFRALRRFRQLFPNSKMVSKASEDAYLKQHLSEQDWKLWEQMQANPEEGCLTSPAPQPGPALSRSQFSLLMSQYKRAGLESYQLWCQSQKQTDFGLDDILTLG